MNMHAKRKWHSGGVLAVVVLAAALALVTTSANAIPTISASVGGVPVSPIVGSINYENFDHLNSGSTTGSYMTMDGRVTVSFKPDAQAVTGSSSGQYAAPYLSNHNGTLFGDTQNGKDTTTYLTSGANGGKLPNAGATLTFSTPEKYLGLLWGSVDKYNTLTFYTGTSILTSFTGDNVTALANGNQGAQGTYYVNIDLSTPFTSVVATSSKHAFEFDNVAFSQMNPTTKVPEPGILGIFTLGLLLVGSGFWLRGRRLTQATPD